MMPSQSTTHATHATQTGTAAAAALSVAGQQDETQVPDSVPHFKSFDHITDLRVRRAKDYEQYLQFALEKFPDYRNRIEREIVFAQEEQQRSKVPDRDRVFLAVGDCELNKEEICEDTQLPASTIYKHLRALVALGLVTERRLPGRGNKFMIVYGHMPGLRRS